MPVKPTPTYMEAVHRFYANHKDELVQAHLSHLGNSALDEAAQQRIVDLNAPHLAHHPAIAAIGALPKSEHAKEVTRIHEREAMGPEPDDNSETDRVLGPKATRMRGHVRRRLPRNWPETRRKSC